MSLKIEGLPKGTTMVAVDHRQDKQLLHEVPVEGTVTMKDSSQIYFFGVDKSVATVVYQPTVRQMLGIAHVQVNRRHHEMNAWNTQADVLLGQTPVTVTYSETD